MLHGDWGTALASNPMSMLALPFLVFGVARRAWRWSRHAEPVGATAPAWMIWALLGSILVFAVLRNLPGFS
jgi:hypothetical protein